MDKSGSYPFHSIYIVSLYMYIHWRPPCNLGVYRSSVFGCVFTYHDCCIHLSMFGDILVQSTNTFPLSYDCLRRVFEVWEWSKLYTVFFSAYIYNLVTYVHFNSGVHTCTCLRLLVYVYIKVRMICSNHSQMTTPVPDTSVVECVWPEGRDIGSL